MSVRKQSSLTGQRYEESMNQRSNVLTDGSFAVQDNLKATYDMWTWIYQEIANIRQEVSRLGLLVRMNRPNSPEYLDPYHAHIYSLLVPVSTVVNDYTWNRIELMWLEIKNEIVRFNNQRRAVHNKKIPFELIRRLDGLYRVALLLAQKAGLGFRVELEHDVGDAIAKAIAGAT